MTSPPPYGRQTSTKRTQQLPTPFVDDFSLNFSTMNRRTFIQMSSVAAAGSTMLPVMDQPQDGRLKNWAGNIEYSTSQVHYPRSVEEVQTMVKQFPKYRALGTRHCFNRIADSNAH